jgi:hypothetical protein
LGSLVLPPEELDRLKYTPQANELFLNEQILLVTTDEMDGILADELERSGLLETGNLVIQSPYNTSNYVHFDKASSNFAFTKYLHFITLCGLLGATEVIVEQIEIKTSKGKQLFKGALNSLYATGNIEGIEEIRKNLKITGDFDGGKPDLEEAEAHLRKYQLLSDTAMTSLIDQRKGSNPIKSREVTLSLSEESRKILKVVSDVKIPTYADLQAQIGQVSKEVYEFTLTIKVKF